MLFIIFLKDNTFPIDSENIDQAIIIAKDKAKSLKKSTKLLYVVNDKGETINYCTNCNK